jgi:hypothetical protein
MDDMVKAISKFDKLYYSHDEIIAIYAEALQKETGMPIPALSVVMDFESYKIKFDSELDQIILYIEGVDIQFEVENETVICVNYMDGSGWYVGY